jgi:hypothetical protein
MIKQLKIGGHIYKVLCPYVFKESNNLRGQCDSDLNELRLKDTDSGGNLLAESSLEASFVHEIIHAIDVVYNNDSLNDDVVERLAQGLLQVLKDNYNFSFLKEGVGMIVTREAFNGDKRI